MVIKTILFDLGNVLLNFSHDRMCQQLAGLFNTSPEAVREVILTSGLYDKFDLGKVSEEQIHEDFQSRFEKSVSLREMKQAVGDIFEVNVAMRQLLPVLKAQGLRLVLLSNTCVTHIDWIRDHFDTLSFFDDLVLSYEVGVCKPDVAIFEIASQRIECEPVECLYTDDVAIHVEAGRRFGLNAELFTGSEKFREDFRRYGVTV